MDVFINYWKKEKDSIIIKIVEWAHRNRVKVENLNEGQIKQAIKGRP